ncbi:hypothetical protein C0J52_05493 [Blattella germanica]|nr:hypothetical protein C0J52_05493 [Blattella germanica]
MISGALRDVIWRNKFKTCVRSIMIYAAETRADTKKTEQLVSTNEIKILRSITGYTLYDKKINEEIRSTCGITNIKKWIKQRRQGWKDHVNRMSENRLPKLAMTFEPDTPRPVGRQPTRWKQS